MLDINKHDLNTDSTKYLTLHYVMQNLNIC